ncbi:Lysine exporter protein (LYSE/YGGA) [Sediminispirochaeta smaragdinae DSM 11293]|uniref:Lysine exporter protein (LYSE/YGGA) n=2 Tax=Sediminispirochaeta TaxID=1911556 RepID=E1RAN5_SEDSS|nr:Lysine exporter protein (LYSE/YGGA) [Sediminispirochaeta smaragdinae DSM 11293]
MFGIVHYPEFIMSGIILNLIPGSDTIYILTRSIAQGRKAGFYSTLGISSGILVHTSFAALGLSAILAQSAVAFSIVSYCGALYLLFLGIRTLVSRSTQALTIPEKEEKRGTAFRLYRQGFLTNLLNPKVVLFFLSFLPQFIDPHTAHGIGGFLLLGMTFLTTGTLWCLALACAASRISAGLRSNRTWGNYLQKTSGVIFILLGAKLLVHSHS